MHASFPRCGIDLPLFLHGGRQRRAPARRIARSALAQRRRDHHRRAWPHGGRPDQGDPSRRRRAWSSFCMRRAASASRPILKGATAGKTNTNRPCCPRGARSSRTMRARPPGCGLETDTGKVVIMLPRPAVRDGADAQALCGAVSGAAGTGDHRLPDGARVWHRGGRGRGKDPRSDRRGQPDRGDVCQRERDVCPHNGQGRDRAGGRRSMRTAWCGRSVCA